jgi:hypothetical protein
VASASCSKYITTPDFVLQLGVLAPFNHMLSMSSVPILNLPSERCLAKQLSVAWIGVVVIRPWRFRPAETVEAENEQDRECRENEDSGENVDKLKELKHG